MPPGFAQNAIASTTGSGARPRMRSAIFSAIMIVGALRLPVTISGMIEAVAGDAPVRSAPARAA
jgi:hypothetical protein